MEMAEEQKPARMTIPSDLLHTLVALHEEVPGFRQLLRDIIQIVIVVDASAVQWELRWRLCSRTNPTARTGLHEAIDSGVVIAVAPIFLKQEIEEHLPRIAADSGVNVDVANAEWQRVQSLIRFYAPIGDGADFASVDPEDSPYALTARELDADFVRTADGHFERMGVTVIGRDLDATLRDYARSTSIIVTVKLGSGYALTFSIVAFAEMVRGIATVIRRLPPAVRVLLATSVAVVLLHPKSRAKVIDCAKHIWQRIREAKPLLIPILDEFFKYLNEARATSSATQKAIRSKLRVRGKQSALSHARLICLRSKEPLTADEIATRILANGYSSGSKNFAAYVRRLLREDARFVVNPDGLWTLRIAA